VFQDSPQVLALRAQSHMRLGLLALAETDATRAIARRHDVGTLLMRAAVHQVRWEHAQALPLLQRVVRIQDDHGDALVRGAICLVVLQRFDEAIACAARWGQVARTPRERVEAAALQSLARALAGHDDTLGAPSEDEHPWSIAARVVRHLNGQRLEDASRELSRADAVARMRLDAAVPEQMELFFELAVMLRRADVASRWNDLLSNFYRIEGAFPPELKRRLARR
jgi:tetratricopeptide (TPR) repeat protein